MLRSNETMEANLLALEKDFSVLENIKDEAEEYIKSLKKIHDLVIYSGIDIDITSDLKNDLFHMKLLWEELEKLNDK